MTGNGKLLEKTMDIDSKKTHLTFLIGDLQKNYKTSVIHS